ncbi:MAG: hypothetical protein K9G39_01855 [Chlorobium sp.]|uniref:hypothetical protein n=1 Tax=Chlorobium sp. TaxID=1095 RepID=UPI0025C73B50|nr:hypothetical protein [Chlorobium sp.]MCF8382327.1 hypothetical protein [Chlorobium sp.]
MRFLRFFPVLAGMALFVLFRSKDVSAVDYPVLYPSMKDLPQGVGAFVEKGTLPLILSEADLDGDGLNDFILVLERQKVRSSDPEIEVGQRPLFILIRQQGGALRLVRRNDDIVYCSACGGVMGDPFMDVGAGLKTFTVYHYGGSAWRWSVNYTFNYSRRDRTWQLVRVEEERFHVSEPEKVEKEVLTPPKHYGKIDIADFHPERWKGTGYGRQKPFSPVR